MLKKLIFILPLIFACGDDDIDVDAGPPVVAVVDVDSGPPDAAGVDMGEAEDATIDVEVVDAGAATDEGTED